MSSPRFTKEFSSYLAADAWIESNGFTHSILDVRDSGETTVTLEGEFAERAYEAEYGPLAPDGFRLTVIERAA